MTFVPDGAAFINASRLVAINEKYDGPVFHERGSSKLIEVGSHSGAAGVRVFEPRLGVAIHRTYVVHIGGLRGLTLKLTGTLRRAVFG